MLVNQPPEMWNQIFEELKQLCVISMEARKPQYVGV